MDIDSLWLQMDTYSLRVRISMSPEFKEFDIPIYGWKVYFYASIWDKIGLDWVEFNKSLVKYKLANEYVDELKESITNRYDNFGYTFHNGYRRTFVVVCIANNRENYYDILSHEVSHMVDRMFDFHSLEGTETRSYLTGYIYRTLYQLKFVR